MNDTFNAFSSVIFLANPTVLQFFKTLTPNKGGLIEVRDGVELVWKAKDPNFPYSASRMNYQQKKYTMVFSEEISYDKLVSGIKSPNRIMGDKSVGWSLSVFKITPGADTSTVSSNKSTETNAANASNASNASNEPVKSVTPVEPSAANESIKPVASSQSVVARKPRTVQPPVAQTGWINPSKSGFNVIPDGTKPYVVFAVNPLISEAPQQINEIFIPPPLPGPIYVAHYRDAYRRTMGVFGSNMSKVDYIAKQDINTKKIKVIDKGIRKLNEELKNDPDNNTIIKSIQKLKSERDELLNPRP